MDLMEKLEQRLLDRLLNDDQAKGGGCESDDLVGKYVVVRTYSAGVHYGILVKRKGKECTLTKARRIWYWAGAATLSELALSGVKKPEECKFSVELDRIDLTEAIEYILCSEAAVANIAKVEQWRA